MYRKLMKANVLVHIFAMNLFRLIPCFALQRVLPRDFGLTETILLLLAFLPLLSVLDKYLMVPIVRKWDEARIAVVKEEIIKNHPLAYLLLIQEEFGQK